MLSFNYGQLRERIKDSERSQKDLADRLGISANAFSRKLNGRLLWRQEEIYGLVSELGIPADRISEYFFTPKVHNSELQRKDETE